MLVFLDTEFTDFINCELISIGMVTADGQDFYAEVQDFDIGKCNEFVRGAVCEVLGQTANARVVRAALPERLRAWFASLSTSVVVACDSFIDWELLSDALDCDFPQNVVGRYDLGPLASVPEFQHAVAGYHSQPGHPWHHALHDAHANRAGWLAIGGPT
ncbi:3'-5' exoribonuclease [Cupriavidus sp. amp6]|uniref:3'-5' exoribonuclease n=1 Tax=Cupriavidus sp. amp6 TaxID=388051 RepID=UPI0004919FF1|nr:3'-5' exoribonuclease [Cupriavidus sp. amp6]